MKNIDYENNCIFCKNAMHKNNIGSGIRNCIVCRRFRIQFLDHTNKEDIYYSITCDDYQLDCIKCLKNSTLFKSNSLNRDKLININYFIDIPSKNVEEYYKCLIKKFLKLKSFA